MSKEKTIIDQNASELSKQISAKTSELAILRRNIATMRETKVHKVKQLKGDIARLKTSMNQLKENKS